MGVMVRLAEGNHTPVASQPGTLRNVVDLSWHVSIAEPSADATANTSDAFHVVAFVHPALSFADKVRHASYLASAAFTRNR